MHLQLICRVDSDRALSTRMAKEDESVSCFSLNDIGSKLLRESQSYEDFLDRRFLFPGIKSSFFYMLVAAALSSVLNEKKISIFS